MPPDETLGFARSPLVRHSAERGDGASLRRALADPAARTVLIAGETPVLRTGPPATSLLPLAALARLPAHQEQAHLGHVDGRPVLATLAEASAADLLRDDPAFTLLDLRSIAVTGAVPPEELGLLATGKALLHWHARHRFCANCGTSTTLVSAGFRRDCTGCGAQHFPRTDPVAIMLITRGESCLLGRQPRFPKGVYSCLAGFIEPGETLEDAVRRETFEEAGITIGRVRYQASQPWPFPSSLMLGCVGEALTEAVAIDRDELEDARWFARAEVALMLEKQHPDELTTPPPLAIAHHLIREWVNGVEANRLS